MKFLFNIPLLLFMLNLNAQEAWIKTIKTPIFERVFDIQEIPNGHYLAVGRRDLNTGPKYAFFVEISKEGEIIRQQDIIIPDSSTSLHQFISVSDTSFIMTGIIESDTDGGDNLWIVHFNYNFNILKQKRLPCFPGLNFIEYRAKLISNGNLLFYGFVKDPDSLFWSQDLYFYETNLDGDSISSAVINLPYDQISLEFIERRNGQGFDAYAMGNFPEPPPGIDVLLRFDSAFNLISIDSIPRNLFGLMNAKWLSECSYLLTGKKIYHNPTYDNMGILKLDTLDQVLNENYLGLQPDTTSYPGSSDNIDFVNPDSIFYSGTGNFTDYPYQSEPSWIIVNCLDSNLNLRWQSLYGGDAFYHSWEVYATSDGGCIVAASKYDYTIPEYDYNVVLLKYDGNGLLTGIDEDKVMRESMLIYPNPGNEVIKIDNNFEDAVFQIFDESGRNVVNSSLETGLNDINVSIINSGIYIYVISVDNKQVSSGKWIKR